MARIDIGFDTRGALIGLRNVNDQVYTDDVLTAVGARKIGQSTGTGGGTGGGTGTSTSNKPLFGVASKYLLKVRLVGYDNSTFKRKSVTIRCTPEKAGDAMNLAGTSITFPGDTSADTIDYVNLETDKSFR